MSRVDVRIVSKQFSSPSLANARAYLEGEFDKDNISYKYGVEGAEASKHAPIVVIPYTQQMGVATLQFLLNGALKVPALSYQKRYTILLMLEGRVNSGEQKMIDRYENVVAMPYRNDINDRCAVHYYISTILWRKGLRCYVEGEAPLVKSRNAEGKPCWSQYSDGVEIGMYIKNCEPASGSSNTSVECGQDGRTANSISALEVFNSSGVSEITAFLAGSDGAQVDDKMGVIREDYYMSNDNLRLDLFDALKYCRVYRKNEPNYPVTFRDYLTTPSGGKYYIVEMRCEKGRILIKPQADASYDLHLHPDGEVYRRECWKQNGRSVAHGITERRTAKGQIVRESYRNGVQDNSYSYVENLWNKTLEARYSDGGRYSGGVLNGKLHGKGTLTHSNGTVYKGSFRNDTKEGLGTTHYYNGDVHIGEYRAGNCNGMGRLKFKDGTEAVGHFKDGLFHGECTMTYTNGNKHVGNYVNGAREGAGEFFYADGAYFKGEFSDWKRVEGSLKLKSGSIFEGSFENDAIYKGTMKYTTGSVYTGTFHDWQRSGQGKYLLDNGQSYEGLFVEGRCVSGTFTYASGTVVEGKFSNWDAVGQCKVSFKDGAHYKGELDSDNHFSGKGCFTYPDGRRVVGNWVAGWYSQELKYDAGSQLKEKGKAGLFGLF